jgi:hypothetical protein
MKNKAYKEIVDEQRNEKEDDTALIENEFDLIANRKSRGGLEGILIDYTSVVELLIIEEALAISFKTTVKLSFSSFDYCI